MSQVSFPVFRLNSKKPLESNGVLYYSNSYINQDTGKIETFIKIIDNRNEPGDTLAARRLKMLEQQAPMYPLRTSIYYLGDFIKLAKSNYWFIDSSGKIFTYKKTISAKLVFKRILQVLPSKATGSIIEVDGIAERFKTLFIPDKHLKYAGILQYKHVNILYGIYDKQYTATRRMI